MRTVQKSELHALYTNVLRVCGERDITIAELERGAGLGNGVVRKWGHASPTLRTVLAVSRYLGISVDDLIGTAEL